MSRFVNRFKHEVSRVLIRPLYRRLMGKVPLGSTRYDPRIPTRRAKAILRRHGLGYDENGTPSWWYQAFDGRNSADQLTQFEFDWIEEHVPKDGSILVSGCGVGLTTIWLNQQGFESVSGFDYLPEVLACAVEIAAITDTPISYWQADGFNPQLTDRYDCITAMHWVYSAWMGNYDNPIETREDHQAVLEDFLRDYVDALKPRGSMLLELVDGLLDYAVPEFKAYPIRLTVEQVRSAATNVGLELEKVVSNPLGNRPIVVLYILRRP